MKRGVLLKRIVVTGMGVISPLGHSVAAFWEGLTAGKNALGPLQGIDLTGYRATSGGQVRDFAPDPDTVGLGRGAQFAVAAARQAFDNARLDPRKVARRLGVCLGTTVGECKVLEAIEDTLI